jgi:SAM-dependent methyltransferase
MTSSEDAEPREAMMQMIHAMIVSRCVTLVAELGVADHLEAGPRDAASLAGVLGLQSDGLYRVLRLLSSVGVFVALPDGRFGNTPLAQTLRSDLPGSLRPYARWFGTALQWQMVSDLDHSVRTGQPALIKDRPSLTPFDVLSQDPQALPRFNGAMTSLSLADGAAIVEAYDFSRFDRILDVGGGHGALARMIARAAPTAQVSVLDLPHVIEGAKQAHEQDNPTRPIRFIPGSFLDAVPGPVNLCVLKHVLHDWKDETATRVLNHCHDALAEGGRVLVGEMLITPGPESIPARILDIEMMIGPGGRERTEAEFADLFAAARLKLTRVVQTRSPIYLLEAVRA